MSLTIPHTKEVCLLHIYQVPLTTAQSGSAVVFERNPIWKEYQFKSKLGLDRIEK